jgi:dTDP-4-amino-4,6-dideoxygalactose transaminase
MHRLLRTPEAASGRTQSDQFRPGAVEADVVLHGQNWNIRTSRGDQMSIPFLDLQPSYRELQVELDAAFRRVMESGWFILGEEVDAFERAFAEYCDAKYCIGVGSGLDALILILRGYGIGPGDEVIVPANTYIATWLAVSYVGAKPVPVEPSAATYNIDPKRIKHALTRKTRAVIAVHLYGQTAEMEHIVEFARRYQLRVIEDAAQAHGAAYNGKRAGALADAAGFSFYPSKNLGAFGDGGAVLTSDNDLADRVRVLRNYGSRTKYYSEIKGVNSRLDALQAAFLRVKLKLLDEWNDRRRAVAQQYLEGLSGVADLRLPIVAAGADPVWHLFVIRYSHRSKLQHRLNKAGIGTLIHYPIPPHLSKAYADAGFKRGDFPIAEELAQTTLSLPIGPHLDAADATRTINAIRRFAR